MSHQNIMCPELKLLWLHYKQELMQCLHRGKCLRAKTKNGKTASSKRAFRVKSASSTVDLAAPKYRYFNLGLERSGTIFFCYLEAPARSFVRLLYGLFTPA